MTKRNEHEERFWDGVNGLKRLNKYWEILPEEQRRKIVSDAAFAMAELMVFRNIANGFCTHKEPAKDVAVMMSE